ncbi:MAG: DUF1259 domain-containing protein [Minisyncoccia bacterium]
MKIDKKLMVVLMANLICLAISARAAEVTPKPPVPVLDKAKIEQLTGLKGSLDEKEGVFKVSSPRNDVKISVDKWPMPAFMGLTSWAAFKPGVQANFMVMGDLVLFEDEVNPVLGALLTSGLSVTALHNHFFYDHPKVYFMHIGGEGTLDLLATGVRKAMDKVKEIRTANPIPAAAFSYGPMPTPSKITGQNIEKIIGVAGQSQDGMHKVVVGREVSMECGCSVGKDMGVNTWAAFAGSDADALVDGDFAILETELQSVLKSLHKSNINIVAIHHHMVGETPRMLFLHYWGRGKATDLAKGVKMALQLTK